MTAISDVAIGNQALTKLGVDRITSFDDNTKPARDLKALYDFVRDAEIYAHAWRFSLKRASLAALDETPEGYLYAYQLPGDCLRLRSCGDAAPAQWSSEYRTGIDSADWSVEGRKILTNLPAPLLIRYSARITDPSQFDMGFVSALACRLAVELCESLTQSTTKKTALLAEYRAHLSRAVLANAVQVPPTYPPDDSWMAARNG